MTGEDIPRLFQLLSGHPTPQPGAEPAADGIQWTDRSICVHWRDGDRLPQHEEWAGWPDLAGEELTVVWLRQDTYVDEAPTEE